MLATAISTLLALVEGLLPALGVGSGSIVAEILKALETIVPIIAADATDFLQPIQNIIAALQSSGALTADQLTQLTALNTQVDAAFEAAAAADGIAPAAPAT